MQKGSKKGHSCQISMAHKQQRDGTAFSPSHQPRLFCCIMGILSASMSLRPSVGSLTHNLAHGGELTLSECSLCAAHYVS